MPAAIAEPPAKPITPTPEPSMPPPTPPKPPASPVTAPATDTDDDPWQGLDARIAGAKPDPKPPEKQAEAKPGEDKKTAAEAKPPTVKEPKVDPVARKQWEEELGRAKADVKTKEEAIAKYEARLAEYEAKGKDTEALVAKITQIEKERDDAKAEVRAAKAEMSPDFKEKWDEPFKQAAEYAREEISTLQIGGMVEDPETGTSKWTPQRKVDWDTDFRDLYAVALKSPAAAMEKANALFGPNTSIVWDHIKELKRLDRNRSVAKAEEGARWKEKDAADRAAAVQKEVADQKQQKEQRASYETALAKKIEQLSEEHPEWYSEDPTDPEGNALLKEGRKLFEFEPKTEKEALATFARNQLNAITALRERNRNRILREENAQLKAENEELRKGSPGPGSKSTSDVATTGDEDDMAGLDKIMAGKF